MHRHLLSARDALNIAAQYGFHIHASTWQKKMIRDGIVQARHKEARPDPNTRRKTAVRYFDEYMAKAALERRGVRRA